MDSIPLLWQRIERWLASHAPAFLDRLNPGASEEELAQAQAALSVTFLEDFKASYRIHNGGWGVLPPWVQGEMLTLADVVGVWEMLKEIWEQGDDDSFPDEPPGSVQPFHWHPKWIPFLWSGYGADYLCLDFDPGPTGQLGQIVNRLHESDPAMFIASSFEALLSQAANNLEAGKYLIISNQLEERLTQGNAARDQARAYDEQQPSPGSALFAQVHQFSLLGPPESVKRSEEELKRLYLQVLQMQQSSSIDRCRAYHQLIRLHLKGLQRSEAERLLVAFEAQALSLPPDHWVYDDLKDDTASVFGDRRVLDYARQAAAEGDEERAFRFLSNTLEQLVPLVFKPWVTTEDQFEVYMLAIDLHLRRRQMKQVRDLFVEFAAQAQKQPPEDPVHETVRDLAARLQETSEEQK